MDLPSNSYFFKVHKTEKVNFPAHLAVGLPNKAILTLLKILPSEDVASLITSCEE